MDALKFFKDLNLDILMEVSKGWAEVHPMIERLTLYRARAVESYKYALIAEVPPITRDSSQELQNYYYRTCIGEGHAGKKNT